MKRYIFTLLFTLSFFSVSAQFLLPVFETPVKVKGLSNEAEETSPITFNQGQSIFYHRTYLDEEGTEVEGKDIWFSEVDEKASKKIPDSSVNKYAWERPYRLFRDGEVEGINAIIGSSADGQRVYLLNTTFTEDTFHRKIVYLDRKGKNSWENEYHEIKVDGLMFDGRNIDFRMNAEGDLLLVSMSPKKRSLNEDLYVSFKKPDGSWTPILDLGPNINTNRFEVSPFMSADKKTLYFTSNGYDGFGGGDIYMSHRLDDSWQKWTRPLNLGAPINSKDYDAYFTISNENDIYFVSDRNNANYADVYYSKTTGEYRLPNVDSIGGEFFYQQLPVASTKLEIYDVDGNLIEIIETDEEGKFNFVKLAADDDYIVQLSADDNSDLVGGKVYLLDENGERKERFILAEDRQFKPAEQIDKKEKIQGVYTYNEEPQSKAALALEDENEFVIDTIYTDSVGGFEYYKLIYDKDFEMYPIGLSSAQLANADLYLTDEKGVRIRTFELKTKESGKGKLMKENLAVANSIIKVFDKSGNLVETIVTKKDGSFSYKKLNLSEDMVMKLDESDDGDLVGGIVYLVDEDNKRSRFFIQEGNELVHPSTFGKETVYGVFKYNKLPLENTALVVLDQNGMPIDTVYTDENGVFEFEKMKLDENYSIRLLDPKDDDGNLEVYLTDAEGNKTQAAKTNKDGVFAFISNMDEESLVDKEAPKKSLQATAELTMYFDFNQVFLSAKAKSVLRKSLSALKSNGKIQLVGHTDDVGSKSVNQRVGGQRAEAVKAYLVSQGIEATKIETSSAGESKPTASNDTKSGRAKNRRVEVKK